MKTVRSLLLCTQEVRIILQEKDAVAGCLPARSVFCAASVRRESRHIQSPSGCVIHAGRNGKCKQSRPDLDEIHESVQKVLWMPSDAGTQFFHRRISVSPVCQVYGNSGRARDRNSGIHFQERLLLEPDRNNTAYSGWKYSAVYIL